MDLKTKADREYLLLVYRTSVGGVVDYKATTCTDDQLMRFRRLIRKRYIERANNGFYQLSALGLQAAYEAEELAEQDAEAAADRRRDEDTSKKKAIRDSLRSWLQFLIGLLANFFGKN